MSAPARTVYVAPHLDDVALSIGGTVALDGRSGRPAIVTVFAGVPSGPPSEFARLQHERWGLDADTAVATRREEDRRAAMILGDDVETIWLDYPDAIYRDPVYGSDDALFGTLTAGDVSLVGPVVDALEALNADAYEVPLAVGRHVDHQLVFRAGRRLAGRGALVWAYQDLPYALDNQRAVTDRLARGTTREAHVTYLDDDAMGRKVRAVAAYRSQVPVLFRDSGDPDVALGRHARAVGGGRPAEVCWRVLAPSR